MPSSAAKAPACLLPHAAILSAFPPSVQQASFTPMGFSQNVQRTSPPPSDNGQKKKVAEPASQSTSNRVRQESGRGARQGPDGRQIMTSRSRKNQLTRHLLPLQGRISCLRRAALHVHHKN
ncbi:hypothetical protein LZ30DRAFT_740096 [Colletotrichum cereale]|nr:hypothetical protein LZ30DRAFT_740096 [Colletotrichum cereale]